MVPRVVAAIEYGSAAYHDEGRLGSSKALCKSSVKDTAVKVFKFTGRLRSLVSEQGGCGPGMEMESSISESQRRNESLMTCW